jgi:hypothetical protein
MLRRKFYFALATEDQNAKSNVKITHNEACVLENQVRQQNQIFFNEFFKINFSIFEFKSMIKAILFKLLI